MMRKKYYKIDLNKIWTEYKPLPLDKYKLLNNKLFKLKIKMKNSPES